MADRIVMGYWDCKYCGTNGIEGVKRDCPNCGHPRDKDTVFYMRSRTHEEVAANNEYLTEKQAATKGKGADWECSFCGALNSVLNNSCKSCGHLREESDLNYFRMRAREDGTGDAARDGTAVSGSAPAGSAPADNAVYQPGSISHIPSYTRGTEQKSFPWKKILLAVVILLGIFLKVWNSVPHPKTLHVLNKSWEYTIYIDEYRYVSDSGWSLPHGADLDRKQQEIHHYNSVLDHYETKTRYYTEKVESGSHLEYSYTNNGDGTFTEHSYSVPDYVYETRSETYQDPVYVQVPVYQTKYYYHEWRWVYSRSVNTSGTDSEPYYGQMNLRDKERKNGTGENYYLTAYQGNKTEEIRTYSISEANWFQVETGTDIRVLLDGSYIKELQ